LLAGRGQGSPGKRWGHVYRLSAVSSWVPLTYIFLVRGAEHHRYTVLKGKTASNRPHKVRDFENIHDGHEVRLNIVVLEKAQDRATAVGRDEPGGGGRGECVGAKPRRRPFHRCRSTHE
jgi:hypothetical protein